MVKEKNWLIRTSNFQILGPVSKAKIVEFVDKGSLKEEDEISSGNGYWFLIKERDLVEKYIYGDIPQTFNPITEAPNVLTANTSTEQTGTHNKITKPTPVADPAEGDGSLPSSDDLEYPDMNLPSGDDLEYPDLDVSSPEPSGEIDLDLIDTSPEPAPAAAPAKSAAPAPANVDDDLEGLLPDDTDLEYPDMPGAGPSQSAAPQPAAHDIPDDDFDEDTAPTSPNISDFEEDTDPGIQPAMVEEEPMAIPQKASVKPAKKKIVNREKKKQRNDNLLFLLTSVFLVAFLLAAVIFYYKKVLNKPLPFIGQKVIQFIIPQAEAQIEQQSLIKKKAFSTLKG